MATTVWNFDPSHTAAEFSARHMMMSTVRGRFAPPTGTLVFDPENPAATEVTAEIDLASVDTGFADRDNHLRSPDFFDVQNYPKMTFKSTNVQVTGDNTAKLTGDLTIRNVTKPVTFDVEFLGVGTSPWGQKVAGFTATGKIDREAWDLTWNVALETGGWLVGKEIKIMLEVEAIAVTEQEQESARA